MKVKDSGAKELGLGIGVPLVAKKVFITKGVGVADKKLTSREKALTDAGIEKVNLIKASSIIPPGCQFVSLEEGKEQLAIGQIAFAIMAEAATDEPHKLIAAAIGIAKPDDENEYGFFTEIEQEEGYGKTEEKASEEVMRLAIHNLALSWRAPFDPEKDFDPKKTLYRIKNKNVRVSHMTQTTFGDPGGLHTTVFVAAVFLF
ncbi:MAG: pyruvoyl-dependent arginine decarboxylase [Acidobacteriota bacterium]|nr:pyruvoyl-dependent arginine decarboxylase [Acidobacteriota bacterium]